MQFQLTRYEYVKSIEFKNTNPLLNVERIRYFKEFELTGNFISKEFRYSWDDNIWTNWNTLTQGNLAGIEFRDRPNFYIHVRYNRTGVGTANIQRFYLYCDSTTPTPPSPPDASIDAFTLQGELPAYYLDRTNHLGPYTDIVIQNLDNGGTIGVYDNRVDTSVGTTFYFKRIGGRGGINVYEEPFGKIIVDGSAITSDISALDSSVSNLYSVIELLDSSISYLIGWNSSIDASIIRIDSSIADLYSRDVSIGVVNVGGGSAGSFAGFDSSNNIRLRTFVSGSPQATVTEVGDQIIITLDASYSGESNYGINLGGGDASIYSGKTGDGLEFREIRGIGSVVVSASDNLILIDSSGGGSGTYDTSLDPNLEMPTEVGGIPAGTKVSDLSGDTFIQLFDNLLFPTVHATVGTNRSASISGISSTTVEVGTAYTPSVVGTFNMGNIINGDGTLDGNLVGTPNQYEFLNPINSVDGIYNTSLLSQAHTFSSFNIRLSSERWSVRINYDAGSGPYYDNKGNIDNNLDYLRIPGTITAYSSYVYGRRRWWWGTGAAGSEPTDSVGVRALINTSLFGNTLNTGTFDITIPIGDKGVYFFVPFGRTIKVEYVESSFANVTGTFTTSAITVNDAGGAGQSYTSYVATIPGVGYTAIATYRVTIT